MVYEYKAEAYKEFCEIFPTSKHQINSDILQHDYIVPPSTKTDKFYLLHTAMVCFVVQLHGTLCRREVIASLLYFEWITRLSQPPEVSYPNYVNLKLVAIGGRVRGEGRYAKIKLFFSLSSAHSSRP